MSLRGARGLDPCGPGNLAAAKASIAAAAVAAALALTAAALRPALAAEGMIEEPIAAMQGLDKITARISRFDVAVGQPQHFGTLAIVVRDCEKSAPEARPENAAFVEISESRPGEDKLLLFSGWMFSSSPALSALEHPIYDVNLLECKGAAPPAPPPIPAVPTPPGRSRGKTAR